MAIQPIITLKDHITANLNYIKEYIKGKTIHKTPELIIGQSSIASVELAATAKSYEQLNPTVKLANTDIEYLHFNSSSRDLNYARLNRKNLYKIGYRIKQLNEVGTCAKIGEAGHNFNV